MTMNIITSDQQHAELERIRELAFAMLTEERPLTAEDARLLLPFVRQVREEIVETTTPGRRGIRRTSYYMLNERGRDFCRRWAAGRDKIIRQMHRGLEIV